MNCSRSAASPPAKSSAARSSGSSAPPISTTCLTNPHSSQSCRWWFRRTPQREENPVVQLPRPHRCSRAVEHLQQRRALLLVPRADEFEIPRREFVKPHIFLLLYALEGR